VKLVLKIALGIALGLTVLTVGCAALIGAGASSVSKEMDKQEKQAQVEGRSLVKRVAQVEHGMTRDQVIAIMGRPESTSQGNFDGLGTTEILTWDVVSDGRFVTVTLDNGKVNSIDKSSFGS
jgi:outer membrane protein assembly factor BamE (lipoprotein component of BamABCDE complex)